VNLEATGSAQTGSELARPEFAGLERAAPERAGLALAGSASIRESDQYSKVMLKCLVA